jgi:hypothetical protein|nr:MAG TPA: protein of unknown function (DUF4315) [Caudoviricetes sp.]
MEKYREDLKKNEERIGELVNLIMDYAIKHEMSPKEIDECVNKVKNVFYSNGIVRRTTPEVPVREQYNFKTCIVGDTISGTIPFL